jgi:uncharacterized protein YjbI with pentapeptide repeats
MRTVGNPPDDPRDRAETLLQAYASGQRAFVRTDLRNADLNGARLQDVDLRTAQLEGANLAGADLRRAILRNADLRSAFLRNADLCDADLGGADLRGAVLSATKLVDANLSRADLRGAVLRHADLTNADLHDVNLADADLAGTHLRNATLIGASLRSAQLREADLRGANLAKADTEGALAGGAILGSTFLVDLDIAPFAEADPPVQHHQLSTVDFRAILRSVCSPNLKDFLQRTGMPAVFVEYDVACALALRTDVFAILRSTFLSYGSPDESFARKLYEALHRSGVTTFFFAEHAVPGDKLHQMMRKGVNEHDRVILVCSRASLDRKGVLNEIEETLAREARDGGASYLIPIRLDDYVFAGWAPPSPDTAQSVRDRVVADFTGAEIDAAKFDAGLRKLIAALRK